MNSVLRVCLNVISQCLNVAHAVVCFVHWMRQLLYKNSHLSSCKAVLLSPSQCLREVRFDIWRLLNAKEDRETESEWVNERQTTSFLAIQTDRVWQVGGVRSEPNWRSLHRRSQYTHTHTHTETASKRRRKTRERERHRQEQQNERQPTVLTTPTQTTFPSFCWNLLSIHQNGSSSCSLVSIVIEIFLCIVFDVKSAC